MDIFCVRLTPKAEKDYFILPKHIQKKFDYWVGAVSEFGIRHVRIMKSFHDEPLRGNREGQRSIRLSRSYRAIYEVR